ncbi:hypothetical protein D9C73_005944 [Collichthys lucidus]|uniref:Uncharacterized protein n=1 Tax=Collichthys lucidus TaxID=240159 RepID=A0A4U5U9N2_COLLU|nr:hypothetical protein D9C73_005944 [Collichthys lucidus]
MFRGLSSVGPDRVASPRAGTGPRTRRRQGSAAMSATHPTRLETRTKESNACQRVRWKLRGAMKVRAGARRLIAMITAPVIKLVEEHLSKLSTDFNQYFQDIDKKSESLDWVRDPFTTTESSNKLPARLQEQLLDVSSDRGLVAHKECIG